MEATPSAHPAQEVPVVAQDVQPITDATAVAEETSAPSGQDDIPLFTMFSSGEPDVNDVQPMLDTKKGVFDEFTSREAIKAASENVIGVINFEYNHEQPDENDVTKNLSLNLKPVRAEPESVRHASLSEQIAGVLSTSQRHMDDEDDDGKIEESQAILRQKFDEFAKEKEEMQQQVQQQASSILHFQAYCKSLVICFCKGKKLA